MGIGKSAYLSAPPKTDKLTIDFFAEIGVDGCAVEPAGAELIQDILRAKKSEAPFCHLVAVPCAERRINREGLTLAPKRQCCRK